MSYKHVHLLFFSIVVLLAIVYCAINAYMLKQQAIESTSKLVENTNTSRVQQDKSLVSDAKAYYFNEKADEETVYGSAMVQHSPAAVRDGSSKLDHRTASDPGSESNSKIESGSGMKNESESCDSDSGSESNSKIESRSGVKNESESSDGNSSPDSDSAPVQTRAPGNDSHWESNCGSDSKGKEQPPVLTDRNRGSESEDDAPNESSDSGSFLTCVCKEITPSGSSHFEDCSCCDSSSGSDSSNFDSSLYAHKSVLTCVCSTNSTSGNSLQFEDCSCKSTRESHFESDSECDSSDSDNKSNSGSHSTMVSSDGILLVCKRADGCKDKCITPGCISASQAILKNMDTSVDPCDDFYQFACGKFLKDTEIPEDKSSIATFSTIDDLLMHQLKMIVSEPISDADIKPYRQAKNLYKACMDRNKIEEVGLEPALKMFKKLGGWPILEENWDEESFTWRDSVYKFRKEGFSFDCFIDVFVALDWKNTAVRIINIDQGSRVVDLEYLINGLGEKIIDEYFKFMVEIAVLFGAERNRASEELRESLEFEIQLAYISLPLVERRNLTKLYNPMNITYIQRQFPSIPWLEYINNILAPTNKINESEVVIINTPEYLHGLEHLLSKTPKRIQANCIMWRAATSSVSYLTEAMRKRQLELSTEMSGKTDDELRWEECVDVAAESFALAIGSLYIKRYFKEDAKKNALEMVEGIRKEMYKILNTVEWMDESTRKNALDKARSMVNHIAYPDELLDEKKLIEFYDKLEIDPNEYYKSLLNVSKFKTDYSFSKLREPVNKTDWITHSETTVANAFYSLLKNSIQIPAGILQQPLFSNDRPQYLNYGAIGFVIGHEITHGFDDRGRQFDKNGNLVDWWDSKTKEKYLERAQCIIDQYDNYTIEEINVKLNGVNTRNENIADNSGIREAYLAYLTWSKKNGVEPKLPGLQDYTSQQMFWISAANIWCSKYQPEWLKLEITTDAHSPDKFRVIGSFSNQEEFARDFRCPSGSKMNPIKKCKVW